MDFRRLLKRKNPNPYDLDGSASVPACAKKCLGSYDSNLFLNTKCHQNDCPCAHQQPHTSNSSAAVSAMACLSRECYSAKRDNLESTYDSICATINDGSNESKDAKRGRGLSGGAIAGIVVGCVVFALLMGIIAAFFCLRRRRRRPTRYMRGETEDSDARHRHVSFDKNPHTTVMLDVDNERTPSPPSERVISVIPQHTNYEDNPPRPRSPPLSDTRNTVNSTYTSTQDSSLQPEAGSASDVQSSVVDSFPEPPPEARHRLYAPMIKEYNRSRHSSGTA